MGSAWGKKAVRRVCTGRNEPCGDREVGRVVCRESWESEREGPSGRLSEQ